MFMTQYVVTYMIVIFQFDIGIWFLIMYVLYVFILLGRFQKIFLHIFSIK